MAKSNQRGSNNNNAHGHNQYTNDWVAPVKDHPLTTAAAVAGAVGAGVFLWSKRNQLSGQISRLGEQMSEWKDSMMASARDMASSDSTTTKSS